MDEDNILGISIIVTIFGTFICCGGVLICRNFICIYNDTIINQNTLLDDRLNDIN